MPKKITKQIRRKILAKHEEGEPFSELKKQFRIKDTRTLQRNLEIAEREREEREIRIRICTDSQQLHLDEIRRLAEQCQEKFKVNFPSGDSDLSVEDDDLFESLKDHFPNTTLWANYAKWREKGRGYKKLWDELEENSNHKAEQETGLKGPVDRTEGLAACFVSSALWYAIDLREKWMELEKKGLAEQEDKGFIPAAAKIYKERKITSSCPYALEFVSDSRDIAWGTKQSVSKCIESHHTLIVTFWNNPKVIDLVDLRKNLVNLEGQLNRELRLALLKRSYISHICDFCPVRAFMVAEI
jgi:hypothetical protein